jgi:xanthine dehydrogenase accessory factor
VLIEPILSDDPHNPIALLKKANARRQTCVLATFFSLKDRRQAQPGTRLFLGQNGESYGACPIPSLAEQWQSDAQVVLQTGTSRWSNYPTPDGETTVFYELLPPAVTLVIVGAGNDVMPLVDMADILGWETKVADGRANYAKPERFARACQVLVAKPEQVLEHIPLDDHTVFALMTHNYNYDKAMLHALCLQNARYIAMLGPRKKLTRMLDEFEQEGRPLSAEQLNTIFNPAGLDIGAETSEEIALAILSEIKTVLSGRQGGLLRNKLEPMHGL